MNALLPRSKVVYRIRSPRFGQQRGGLLKGGKTSMKFIRLSFVTFWAAAAVVLVLGVSACSKKTAGTTANPNPTTTDNEQNTSPPENPEPTTTPTDQVHDASINDVFFAYDDHSLSAEARSTLSGNASYLKEMSAVRVTIEGHCDERGTTEYNLALGQRRADAARNYLVDLGIDGSRMSTISYGEERPFEPGHDETAYAQNRRAHFKVNNP
jgi:peptidoglycan-associated lipoprotein